MVRSGTARQDWASDHPSESAISGLEGRFGIRSIGINHDLRAEEVRIQLMRCYNYTCTYVMPDENRLSDHQGVGFET